MEELFTQGPVVLFRWRNESGWPVDYVSPNVGGVFGRAAAEFLDGAVSYGELIVEEDAERVAEEVRTATESGADSFVHEPYRVRHADGSVRWLYDATQIVRDEAGGATHYHGYVIDVTQRFQAEAERRALEERLLHAQKLESLGVLAGGVAHDFNNLLTGMLGHASLALRQLELDHVVRTNVEQIERIAWQAAELTRQLLAYSGKGRFLVLPLSLGEIVEDMASILDVVISKKASLRFESEPDLPAVMVDQAQIQQIVMNLITNASEALEGESGVVTVRTYVEECTVDYLTTTYGAPELAPGIYVALEVSDTGCGMDTATREKLFDPFFTTKVTGRGLGMSAVLGIVRGHRAALRVYSEPKRGTTFKLLFPACGAATASLTPPLKQEPWRGSGTVLVVDDEEHVREVATRILRELGFATLTANDGAHGLEVYRAHRTEITLVLLDMTMPVMSGKEALKVFRRMDPNLPVVVSSGFNEQDTISSLAGRPATAFLQKPYRFVDIEATVRAALEG